MQINTSFASDEDIKNEILDLIQETKRIWDTQNYSNLKSLWDAEDNNPLYIPEEKVDFPTDWNSLERYWNPVPGKKILDGIRNDYSNIKIKLISKEVAIILMDLNYDLKVINSQPLSGFDRIMCVVVKKDGDWKYSAYIEAPMNPMSQVYLMWKNAENKNDPEYFDTYLQLLNLYEKAVPDDFSDYLKTLNENE
ncbi:MAG: hypothetical protein MK201_03260 [Gammaproteobacteria bacterium]|nr:hypothetical protein [Gammaproteobacteria bacterium]